MSDGHPRSEHPDWPRTVDEAVDRLVTLLSRDNQQAIREAQHVITFHLTLGMWIRNTFGLWEGNQALKDSCARRHGGDSAAPSRLHPDSASTIILEALQERLRRNERLD